MPGDSVIKELNLRLGFQGRSRSQLWRAANPMTGAGSRLCEGRLSTAAEPTSHHWEKRYTKGEKQNPQRARRGGIKEQCTLCAVSVCVCV